MTNYESDDRWMEDSDSDKAAVSFAENYHEPVYTLTHYTRYVAEHFLKWRADKQKKSNSFGASKKELAHSLLSTGSSVSAVAKELGITYANAHYYKRSLNC